MNYQVVFDISQQSFPWWGPAIGILFILFSAALVFRPQLIRPMDSRGHIIMRLIGVVGLIITVPATVDSLTNGLRRYNYYHSLLQQQHGYVVVEGQVENFTPAPDTGNYSDSFTVNSVKFQYSEADLSPDSTS